MNIVEILLIALGLAMDAFAVSVCKGLSLEKSELKKALYAGLWFGFFQALMPVIGYFTGDKLSEYVAAFDHWVVFFLLSAIGVNMIKESFDKNSAINDSFKMTEMLFFASATSIDAFAVGISFALMKVNILIACIIIGTTTFLISVAGVKIGNLFGTGFKTKAEFVGGVILILIGIKVLIQHITY